MVYATYKNGDDWGMVYYCFTYISRDYGIKFARDSVRMIQNDCGHWLVVWRVSNSTIDTASFLGVTVIFAKLNGKTWVNGIMIGWWFGTFFIFPYIGNHNPNWLIFFRGVETTNQMMFGGLFLLIRYVYTYISLHITFFWWANWVYCIFWGINDGGCIMAFPQYQDHTPVPFWFTGWICSGVVVRQNFEGPPKLS